MSQDPTYGFDTNSLHAGQVPDPTTGARAVPLYQTTSYVFNDSDHAANLFGLKEVGNIYTRLMNPTTDVLEKRIAALEGGAAALAVASGQSAITLALLTLAKAGDEIVSTTSLYGGTYNLLHYVFPRFGIKVNFVDANPEAIAAAITDKTRAVYGETIGNPDLRTLDIAAVAEVAHANGLPLVLDNTTPSPALVRPIEHGADIVIHSLTKFIGGHGTSMGGIIVDSGNFDWTDNPRFKEDFVDPDPSYHGMSFADAFGAIAFIFKVRTQLLRDIGPAISPFNSWQILQGTETLGLRMEKHSKNAEAVVAFLQQHPKVTWVNYPGLKDHPSYETASKYFDRGQFGALIGFGVEGGAESGRKVIESVKLLSHLANIGDAKSLIIHPATTTHSQLNDEELLSTGVTPDFIRLSIGLEDEADIIADLEQALAQI